MFDINQIYKPDVVRKALAVTFRISVSVVFVTSPDKKEFKPKFFSKEKATCL